MTLLSANNMPEGIRTFRYDRSVVSAGILHFGIGNFHRAHQAVYVDDLLAQGATQWGITGVSLRSGSTQKALKPQDYLYTLATLGEKTEYRIIGAIKDVRVAPEDPQAIIDLAANPATQLVSSTITEKGYYLASGQVEFQHPDLQAELASLENPTTIYGFLARGIIQRFDNARGSKLTVMCCDNISAGGELLKGGVEHLLRQHNARALEWSKSNVGFISSMVDRVCPATYGPLRDVVFAETMRRDAAPVSAEPFRQWVIEDKFVGERPAFDRVGAIFVDDIVPFEQMKLQYLNAAHTIVSTLGYLYGDEFVHQTLERPEAFNFMYRTLYENVLPNASVPHGHDGAAYIEDVIKRFQNSSLPYANLQVGNDSSQKIQQRWFPTIDQAMNQNADCSYFEFCLGAWVVFIQTALENGVLSDPKKDLFKTVNTEQFSETIKRYLVIASADRQQFFRQPDFIKGVYQHSKTIKYDGIKRALFKFLESKS